VDGKSGKVANFENGAFELKTFEWTGWVMERRMCLEEYLVAYSDKKWNFVHFGTQEAIVIEAPIERPEHKLLNCSLKIRKTTINIKVKDNI
jgi:hypothetical protein